MDTQHTGSSSIGQTLNRGEMKNIMAGFNLHVCHCYCCEGGAQLPTLDDPATEHECDPGGGEFEHEHCQDVCNQLEHECDQGYVCALCQAA